MSQIPTIPQLKPKLVVYLQASCPHCHEWRPHVVELMKRRLVDLDIEMIEDVGAIGSLPPEIDKLIEVTPSFQLVVQGQEACGPQIISSQDLPGKKANSQVLEQWIDGLLKIYGAGACPRPKKDEKAAKAKTKAPKAVGS